VQLEAQNLKRREEAERVSERMEGLSVILIRSAGESGNLYGSVSARDIADGCKAQGLNVSRAQVLLEQPIKLLGLTPVRVELHPEVHLPVIVNVARSPEEAAKQARGEQIEREDEITLEDELVAELGAASRD
jgi:large subunit ribosomal protein L9